MKILTFILLALLSIRPLHLITPADYRDSYTGNYVCQKTHKRLNLNDSLVYTVTTYTVPVVKSITDSMLIITTQEDEFVVKLTGNDFRSTATRFFGKFSGDSIYVRYIPSSGPTAYSYFGKK